MAGRMYALVGILNSASYCFWAYTRVVSSVVNAWTMAVHLRLKCYCTSDREIVSLLNAIMFECTQKTQEGSHCTTIVC